MTYFDDVKVQTLDDTVVQATMLNTAEAPVATILSVLLSRDLAGLKYDVARSPRLSQADVDKMAQRMVLRLVIWPVSNPIRCSPP